MTGRLRASDSSTGECFSGKFRRLGQSELMLMGDMVFIGVRYWFGVAMGDWLHLGTDCGDGVGMNKRRGQGDNKKFFLNFSEQNHGIFVPFPKVIMAWTS